MYSDKNPESLCEYDGSIQTDISVNNGIVVLSKKDHAEKGVRAIFNINITHELFDDEIKVETVILGTDISEL